MRLVELKGYKKSRDSTAIANEFNNVDEFLISKGLSFIDRGTSGSVWDFGNPKWILKLFKRDSGYIGWVNTCIKHKSNSYLPKFKGRLITVDTSNDFRAIIIERLTSITEKDYKILKGKLSIIGYLTINDKNPNSITINKLTSNSYLKGLVYDQLLDIDGYRRHLSEEMVLDFFKSIIDDKHLFEVNAIIDNPVKDSTIDLHSGNIMKRGNQLVITDPWYTPKRKFR